MAACFLWVCHTEVSAALEPLLCLSSPPRPPGPGSHCSLSGAHGFALCTQVRTMQCAAFSGNERARACILEAHSFSLLDALPCLDGPAYLCTY